ncbi:MAG: hypothetical protein PHF86_01550 [Candidatus Nanoarchaeia archaeon]|nr:hypothetical protein [Candidatus Nanoarchaeia archaeon]
MDPILSNFIANSESNEFGTKQNFAYLLNQINGKLVLIDPSGNVSAAISYLDASLLVRDAAIAQIDASIIRIDSSLNNTIDIYGVLDGSIKVITDAISTLNSSVGSAIEDFATNASVGAALGPFTTNASVGVVFANDLRIYKGSYAGVKDASGTNGDVLLNDPSIYIKLGGTWRSFRITDVSFG